MKKKWKLWSLLLPGLLLYSCIRQDKEKEVKQKDQIVESVILDIDSSNAVTKKNEQLFDKATLEIVKNSIKIVLERNGINSSALDEAESIVQLEAKIPGEDEKKEKIKKEVKTKIIEYITNLDLLKTKLLANDSLLTSQKHFDKAILDFGFGKTLRNKILFHKNNTVEVQQQLFKGNYDEINNAITNFKAVPKKSPLKNTNTKSAEKRDNSRLRFWILLSTLVLSLVLLIVVFFRKKKKKPIPEARETIDTSELQKKADTLGLIVINALVNTAIAKKIEAYTSYSKECIKQETVEKEITKIQKNIATNIEYKKFVEKANAIKAIEEQINDQFKKVESLLQDCNSKNEATSKIESRVSNAPNAYGIEGLGNLSENETKEIIEIQKKSIIETLPDTINNAILESKITTCIKTIKEQLRKKIAQGLVYYLPFPNRDGSFRDDKKSSVKKLDSAIVLYVNSNDNTTAEFQYLYDNPKMIKNAILSYDVLLLPVSKISKENFNPEGTQITQIGPKGVLNLSDGFWKVKQKLNLKIS